VVRHWGRYSVHEVASQLRSTSDSARSEFVVAWPVARRVVVLQTVPCDSRRRW
jgi:hypothetical protein